jgi:glycosyltransferase
LDSIKAQKYVNIESIIVDGGSTDGTLEILHKYSSFIKQIEIRPELGIYESMNRGIDLASGEIIGILNSDDLLEDPMSIQHILNAFNNNPMVEAVYGDLVYVDISSIDMITRYWRAGHFTKAKMRKGWMPPHPTFYIRKDSLNKIGRYRTDLGSAGDYEFMLRALFKHKIKTVYIPQILVKMRRGGVSNGSISRRMKANSNDRLAWHVNDLRPFPLINFMKPLRKLSQYLLRPGDTK